MLGKLLNKFKLLLEKEKNFVFGTILASYVVGLGREGKGSKQEWGVSNTVVAAIYSAGLAGRQQQEAKQGSLCLLQYSIGVMHGVSSSMHFLMMNDSWGDSVPLQGWNHRKGKKNAPPFISPL
jgi:hypothetical protein